MADRIHPVPEQQHPVSSTSAATSSDNSGEVPKPPNPAPSKPVPPPGTYVIQLPKEQIFRHPPPESTRKFQSLTRRKNGRSCCRRCCCYTLCLLLLLIVAAAISAGVLYLVYRPESPKYTITDMKIGGLNLTSSSSMSLRFNVTVRAENPNDEIGIHYGKGSAVNVFYKDVKLCEGNLPAFHQPKNNVTVFHTALKGSNIVLGSAVKSRLQSSQRQRRVPLTVRIKAPVKIQIGSVKTWEITVKVKCDVTVDGLNDKANIISKDCDYSVRLW